MKRLLIVGAVMPFLLACGEATPAGTMTSPTPTTKATAKATDTYMQLSSDGATIYFDITDAALVASMTNVAEPTRGIPTGSSISCSNSAGTFFVWNDGTADSASLARSFCRSAKFT